MSKKIKRIVRATGYSLDGLKATYRSEAAFREELILLIIGVPTTYLFSVSPLERALMIGTLLLVLMAELVNTAIETLIERISSEQHDLSKKAKDIGSALVLVALINAGVVWLLILLG